MTAGLPSGALRPPVAVGPLLDDGPEETTFQASPNKSFRSGGWSFPPVGGDDVRWDRWDPEPTGLVPTGPTGERESFSRSFAERDLDTRRPWRGWAIDEGNEDWREAPAAREPLPARETFPAVSALAPPSPARAQASSPVPVTRAPEREILRPARSVAPVVLPAAAVPRPVPVPMPLSATPQTPHVLQAPSACPFCGNVYAADSVFCRRCGQRRSAPTRAPAVAPAAMIAPGRSLALAEQFAGAAPPNLRAAQVAYPARQVDVQALSSALAPLAAANLPHRARMSPLIESGDLVRRTLEVYRICDRDASGHLQWSNGEIQDFMFLVFQQQGLSPPSPNDMYQLFRKFDEEMATMSWTPGSVFAWWTHSSGPCSSRRALWRFDAAQAAGRVALRAVGALHAGRQLPAHRHGLLGLPSGAGPLRASSPGAAGPPAVAGSGEICGAGLSAARACGPFCGTALLAPADDAAGAAAGSVHGDAAAAAIYAAPAGRG
ncbi:unnamed protein product [Effrenium voratum]|uniref:Uncharacterized protein n=1 Tax=Effrenium voratum TaxID=2562239 RepID=A0AA36HV52_9DINO|nr:unnamed protein product [Effrenium voratum]